MNLGDEIWVVQPTVMQWHEQSQYPRMLEPRWTSLERVYITEEKRKVMAARSIDGSLADFRLFDKDDVFASRSEAYDESRRRDAQSEESRKNSESQEAAPEICGDG